MHILSVNVGLPRWFQGGPPAAGGPAGYSTGIAKVPVAGPVQVHRLHLAGDGQGDLVHHGGPDKAVHAYCHAHYPRWEAELGLTLAPGALGENLTLTGVTEADVCIGDVYRAGDVLLQVSQPRIPCYKLGRHLGVADMVQRVLASGATGFYLRVLATGTLAAGQPPALERRPATAVSVAFANRIMHHDRRDRAGLHALLAAEGLAEAWAVPLRRRLEA